MAGIIYSRGLYPFMDKDSSVGIYGALKDINEATSSGYYQVSGIDDTILNAPAGIYGYGNMVVFRNGGYTTQIFYPRSKEGKMAFRSFQDSSWFEWKIF